jgi:hypothetical protein
MIELGIMPLPMLPEPPNRSNMFVAVLSRGTLHYLPRDLREVWVINRFYFLKRRNCPQ